LSDTTTPGPAFPPESPIAKNSQLVWFSDFLTPLAELEANIARFTRIGVQAHLVHLVDPAEEEFPYNGRTRFEASDGVLNETVGRAENVRRSYRSRFRAHAESVAMAARKLKWGYLAHRTDRPPRTALIALYSDMSGAVRR
jgi:uncharacterized protein (DUF58 family)